MADKIKEKLKGLLNRGKKKEASTSTSSAPMPASKPSKTEDQSNPTGTQPAAAQPAPAPASDDQQPANGRMMDIAIDSAGKSIADVVSDRLNEVGGVAESKKYLEDPNLGKPEIEAKLSQPASTAVGSMPPAAQPDESKLVKGIAATSTTAPVVENDAVKGDDHGMSATSGPLQDNPEFDQAPA